MENSKTATAFAIGLLALQVSTDFAVQANDGDCGVLQYRDSQGICQSCHGRTCQPGHKIVTNCGNGQDVTCEPCTDLEPGHTCASGVVRSCISCEHQNKKQVQECDANHDSICLGCLDNYYPDVVGRKVYCYHCREDRQNRTECRTAPPDIQTPGKDNDDPKVPGAEIRKDKDTKGQDVITPVAITAISAGTLVIVAILFVLWRKPAIFKMCKGRPYEQTAQVDVESPRPEDSERQDENPTEEDKAVCHIDGKRVRFLKRQLSSSSTKSEPEDQERLLEDTSTTKSKHRPPKLNLRRTSGVREVNVEVHGARSQSVHDVDATPFPKDGTPSPYPVEEDDVFLHSSKTTEAVGGCPDVSDEAEVPVPGTDMPHTRRESKDLSGQTAKIHSTNNTANKYHTTLALCTKHADTIRLEDEWFNYNIQQKLSVYLDKIQPTPSMPTWRTFFEKFNLTKIELDGVDTRSVPSPTLALFNMLQKSNPGAENYFTVGDVLRQLDCMKFADAASALCDELLEHINQSKS
ncbi:uncharacterized protein LOC144876180 [Branchiostoma floridae x Branchiostoma japonicum]